MCRRQISTALMHEVEVPQACPRGMRSFSFPAESGITQLNAGANLADDATHFTFTGASPIMPDRNFAMRLPLSGKSSRYRHTCYVAI